MRGLASLAMLLVLVDLGFAQDANIALDEPKSVDEKKFLDWLRASGGKLKGIDLANFTNPIYSNFKLRGVKATDDIKAGAELLSIPGDAIISTLNALASPVSPVFTENPQLFGDEQVLLSVYLMYELQSANISKWSYYFKVLPTRFHTSCEFASSELRQLEGSPVFEETQTRQQLFHDEFDGLFPFLAQRYPHFFNISASTFSAYKYTRLLVQTRAFGMHVDGRTVLGIVPMADMLNHDPRAKIAWKYDHTDNVFRMYSEQPYKKGSQISNNYGPRSNRRLLLDFGFVVSDNPFDFVEVPAPVASGSSLDKSTILTDRGLDGKQMFSVHLGEVPDDLMFAARIARATPEEITSYKRSMELTPRASSSGVVPRFNASIGVRNELAALSWLQDTAKSMLGRYRTTYEEDVALLEHAESLPRSHLNALLVSYSEKRIYKFLEDFASVHIPLLNYYNHYASSNSLSNSRLSLAGAEYMRNVLLPLQRSLLEKAYQENTQTPSLIQTGVAAALVPN